jgi:hypothetical protein
MLRIVLGLLRSGLVQFCIRSGLLSGVEKALAQSERRIQRVAAKARSAEA